jgi:hypothetical protein
MATSGSAKAPAPLLLLVLEPELLKLAPLDDDDDPDAAAGGPALLALHATSDVVSASRHANRQRGGVSICPFIAPLPCAAG